MNTLKHFAKVFKKRSYDGCRSNPNESIRFIENRVIKFLKKLITHTPAIHQFTLSDVDIKTICSDIHAALPIHDQSIMWDNKGFSVNFTAFCHLLGLLETCSDNGRVIERLIHDQQLLYQDSYYECIELSKLIKVINVPLPNGKVLRRGITHLKKLEMRDDKDVILLQIADLIVGATNYFYTQAIKGNLNKDDASIFRYCIYHPSDEDACLSKAIIPWSTAQKHTDDIQRLYT